MEAPQTIPIQTRTITAPTCDGCGVTRDCVIWYDREHAGYRAMYVHEPWRQVCEVLLTDATDARCCTGKFDEIIIITPYLRRFLGVLQTHEPDMPHLRPMREYVQALVDVRDDVIRREGGRHDEHP